MDYARQGRGTYENNIHQGYVKISFAKKRKSGEDKIKKQKNLTGRLSRYLIAQLRVLTLKFS